MSERVFMLLSDYFGRTPRRCRLLRRVTVLRHGGRECWLVDAYPPIAGLGADATIIVEFVRPELNLDDVGRKHVLVDIFFARRSPVEDTIDPTEITRFGLGDLVLPSQVSSRAFPFDVQTPPTEH